MIEVQQARTCQVCHKWVTSYFYAPEMGIVCDDCYVDTYEICTKCHMVVKIDDMVISDDDLDIYCPHCLEK